MRHFIFILQKLYIHWPLSFTGISAKTVLWMSEAVLMTQSCTDCGFLSVFASNKIYQVNSNSCQ